VHFENGRSDAGCWRRIERSVRGRRLGVRHPERREDLILLVESLSQGDQDLPLRVHSTVHAFLDTVNGSQRDFGLSGQLRLSHQSILTQLPDAIPLNRSRSTVFHTLPFSLDRPVGRACCYTLVSACWRFVRSRDFFRKNAALEDPFGDSGPVGTRPAAACGWRGRAHSDVASLNPM